jgi:hypothetical protein
MRRDELCSSVQPMSVRFPERNRSHGPGQEQSFTRVSFGLAPNSDCNARVRAHATPGLRSAPPPTSGSVAIWQDAISLARAPMLTLGDALGASIVPNIAIPLWTVADQTSAHELPIQSNCQETQCKTQIPR